MTTRSSPVTAGSKPQSSSGLASVPTLRLSHLDAAGRRAYVIADNKLALNAGWDREILAIELQALIDLDFDVELTGFALAETEIILDEARERSPSGEDDTADDLPPLPDDGTAVTRRGDVWLLDRHRLVCGDAQDAKVLRLAMEGSRPTSSSPTAYNVPIDGHVCGLGPDSPSRVRDGVGEMSREAFTGFLRQTLGNAAGGDAPVLPRRRLEAPQSGRLCRAPKWREGLDRRPRRS